MSPTKTAAVCSHCLRKQHDHCTVPDTCGCPTCNPPAAEAVVWQDPPPSRTGTHKRVLTDEQEAALRANPQRWAMVKQYDKPGGATSTAYMIKKGKSAYVAAEWEATARRNDRGSQLYMRYVGPGGKA
jgi:hypothetical protein